METSHVMPGEDVVLGTRSEIAAYEAERAKAHAAVKWRVPVFLGCWALLILVIALVFNGAANSREQWLSTPHVFLYVIGFILAFVIYGWAYSPASTLQKSFRRKVLPTVFGFVEDVQYKQGEPPPSLRRLPRDTIGSFNRTTVDDVVTGTYEDFAFELCEANLSQKSGKNTTQVFKGVIVAFETITPFPGVLIAAKRSGSVTKFFRGMFGTKLEELQSGVASIDDQYDFRTSNVDAARPLVTGHLAQAMQWLREAWPEQPARVALNGNDGFLLIPVKKNFFELPAISVPLDYAAHIEPLVAELATLLATASLVRKVGAADDVGAAAAEAG